MDGQRGRSLLSERGNAMNLAYIPSIITLGLLGILLCYAVYALGWNIRNRPEEPMKQICINQDYLSEKEMRKLVRDFIKHEKKAAKMNHRRH